MKSKSNKKTKSKFWRPGVAYFLRTVTHHFTGRLVSIDEHELILAEVAWIADDGRFSVAMRTGALSEIEPYPPEKEVAIGRGSLIDAVTWNFPLPKETK